MTARLLAKSNAPVLAAKDVLMLALEFAQGDVGELVEMIAL